MFRPVSTTLGVCCIGYAALNAFAEAGSAVSDDALSLNRAVKGVIKSAEGSQALFGNKAAALSQLNLLACESEEQNWDGYGSSGMNPLARQNTENFVRALPDSIPIPEFGVEPDGSISLDWIKSKHLMFSLSIGPSDRIAFAWLDGTDSGHAVARFDQRIIPMRILDGIQATLRDESATVRAA